MIEKRHVDPKSFAAVIRDFQASPKFLGLAASTQTNYRYTFRLAEHPDALGAYPAKEMCPELVQGFLDGFADRPAQQKCAQTAMKSVEKWAIVRGRLKQQITLGTEAPGGTGNHEPWTDEHVKLAEAHARLDLARLVTLAANTGQRGSDLIKMRWSDIEDYRGHPGINVTQQKTGKVLWVPFTGELIVAMRTWDRSVGYLVVKADGRPYTRPQLSMAWLRHRSSNKALAALLEADLSFHGLRATSVVRLRRAGCTEGEIAAMVGMSVPMVSRYCRRSEQRDNALSALGRLEGTAREQAQIIPFKKAD